MFRLPATRALTGVSRQFMMARATAIPTVSLRLANQFQKVNFYSTLPQEDVSKRIIDVVKNFDKIKASAAVTPDTSFATDLGLDSLDTVEVLVAIEEEFDIEIDDKDADEIKTVGQAIKYITEHPDAN